MLKGRCTNFYSQADFGKFRNNLRLAQSKLLDAIQDSDTQSSWLSWKSLLFDRVDCTVPHKVVSDKRKPTPWITGEIKKLIRKRNRLFKIANKYNRAEHWSRYKVARREVKCKINRSRANYIEHIVSDVDSNPKRFWNYIKVIKTNNPSIDCLTVNGDTITDPEVMAEALNAQFNSVFNIHDDSEEPIFDPVPSPNMMRDIRCTSYEVRKLLNDIDVSKSRGPDNISPRILKEGAEYLAPSLTKLFNASLETGIVPDEWRRAHVVPVFKKGKRDNPSNYRPISLTSVVSKTLERIVCNRLIKHLHNNNILDENQHGFRAQRSCDTQLIDAIHDWSSLLDAGQNVDIIFLDFAKAFDRVRHDLLHKKLITYGVGDSNIKWIMNFLRDREQRVSISGDFSSWSKVKSGVPQGTILGPILFLCFINDISENIHSTIRLYADDCVLYRSIVTDNDTEILQSDLNSLCKWSDHWKLNFNIAKCKVMSMSRKHHSCQHFYHIGNNMLTTTNCERYLGVMINDKLNWSDHCHDIYTKSVKMLGLIKRNFSNCSANILKKLYVSLIRSRLDYCCIAWDPYRLNHSSVVERVQNQSVRFICRDWSTSYDTLLNQVGWIDLRTRRKFIRLIMCFKILKGFININALKKFHPASRIGRNDNSLKLNVPFARTDCFKYSYFVRTADEWNSLPEHVIQSMSLNVFKSSLLDFFTF